MTDIHAQMMALALSQARTAAAAGEVPVGAVVYDAAGHVLAAAHNHTIASGDPTQHAELVALRAAARLRGDPYLTDCTLAVTLEPCALCAQAASYFRVKEIRFGAYDVKSGGTVNGARVLEHAHHKPIILGGLMEEACAQLLRDFFIEKRAHPG